MAGKIKYAFRITHIDNIPHIKRFGFLRANSPLCSDKYITIGDTQVIEIRNEVTISNSKLGEYVPFYFGPRSPMLYVIQHGYNGVKQQAPENIVYCVLRLDDVEKSSLQCVFSDGHALSAITKFYEKDRLKEIDSIINFDDVYASQWNNNENDLDIKRRKEAELLIQDDVPAEFIRGYVVYNDDAKKAMISMGIIEKMIVINPNYYF